MAISVTDQASALIGRRVAETRTGGVPSSDVEARAVFDLIALNIILNPKSVYFVMHLARNGLLKVLADEISLIDDVRAAAADLGNVNLSVRSTRRLVRARDSLIQFGSTEKVDPSSGTFARFDASLTEFLDKELGKSLRRPGASELTRPGDEAASDLATSFAELVKAHDEMLERLYAFPVGASNFFGSPIRGAVGLVTANRVRQDLEDFIESIERDGSLLATRDVATKLITGRATLRTIGSPPGEEDPSLSSASKLPAGYDVTGESDPALASVTTAAGPFTLGAGATLEVTDGTTSVGPVNFPQATVDLADKAWVVGDETAWPITVPADTFLFLSLDGVPLKIPITAGSRVLADIVSDVTAAAAGVSAAEFAAAGSDRLALVADAASEIRVLSSYVDTGTGQSWTDSLHSLVGLFPGQIGTAGELLPALVADALNVICAGILTASADTDGTVTLVGDDDAPGAYLEITAPTALSITGTTKATSTSIRLLGTLNGVQTDPVDPSVVVFPGDTFEAPTGSAVVESVTDSRVILATAIPTFSGNVISRNPLVALHTALVAAVRSFLSDWKKTSYAKDLARIDRIVAATLASRTAAQRGDLDAELATLRGLLVSLQTSLSTAAVQLPAGAAPTEREVVSNVLSTLVERKYDRAESMLLKGMVLETLLLDDASASFGGYVQQKMGEFARQDLSFPDRSKDEGLLTRTAGGS